MALDAGNYRKGFLVDDQLMGGISPHGPAENPTGFSAYVLNHSTGEYLGYELFPTLEKALEALNRVQRPWKFESVSGCKAGADGHCAGESCAKAGLCGKMLSKHAPSSGEPAACGC